MIPRRQPSGPIRRRNCSQAAGLALWYPLCSHESAATPCLDHSGKGMNLLTAWGSTQSLAYIPGYGYGMALGASGVSQQISNTTPVMTNQTPITASLWVYPTATLTPGNWIFQYQGGFQLTLSYTVNNTVGYHPGTASLPGSGVGSLFYWSPLTVGQPVMLTVVTNYTTITLYRNGVVESLFSGITSPKANPNNTITSTMYFGSNVVGTEKAKNATIADFRIYNRALSDDEVWGLYDPATRFMLWDSVDEDDETLIEDDTPPLVISSDCRNIIRPVFRETFRPVFRGF